MNSGCQIGAIIVKTLKMVLDITSKKLKLLDVLRQLRHHRV